MGPAGTVRAFLDNLAKIGGSPRLLYQVSAKIYFRVDVDQAEEDACESVLRALIRRVDDAHPWRCKDAHGNLAPSRAFIGQAAWTRGNWRVGGSVCCLTLVPSAPLTQDQFHAYQKYLTALRDMLKTFPIHPSPLQVRVEMVATWPDTELWE